MIWLAALHAACFAVAPFATLLGGHSFIAGAVPAGIGCAVTATAVLRHGAGNASTMVLASALARVVTTVAAWNRAALMLLLVGEAVMLLSQLLLEIPVVSRLRGLLVWRYSVGTLVGAASAAMTVAAFAGVPVLASGGVQLGVALVAGPVLWRATA